MRNENYFGDKYSKVIKKSRTQTCIAQKSTTAQRAEKWTWITL